MKLRRLREQTRRRLGSGWTYVGSGWPLPRCHANTSSGFLCSATMRLTDYVYNGTCINCLSPRRRDFIARELRRFAGSAR